MKKEKIAGLVFNIVLLTMAVLTPFFIKSYRIPQNGMYPDSPAGKLILTLKHPYRSVSDVKRGNVIVYVRNIDGNSYNFIWRVIGLPGDKVAVSGTKVILNGRPLARTFVRQEGSLAIYREVDGDAAYDIALDKYGEAIPDVSLTVPSNAVFVLGDNREHAADSRVTGPAPFDSIIGKKL